MIADRANIDRKPSVVWDPRYRDDSDIPRVKSTRAYTFSQLVRAINTIDRASNVSGVELTGTRAAFIRTGVYAVGDEAGDLELKIDGRFVHDLQLDMPFSGELPLGRRISVPVPHRAGSETIDGYDEIFVPKEATYDRDTRERWASVALRVAQAIERYAKDPADV